jgi:hypothetical protein
LLGDRLSDQPNACSSEKTHQQRHPAQQQGVHDVDTRERDSHGANRARFNKRLPAVAAEWRVCSSSRLCAAASTNNVAAASTEHSK